MITMMMVISHETFLRHTLQAISDSEEAQICLLHNLYELWSDHQQMMCVLIDKLLKTQIVECSAVATWIFSKEMNCDFTKMYLWEILHLTIKKMNKHVIKLGEFAFLTHFWLSKWHFFGGTDGESIMFTISQELNWPKQRKSCHVSSHHRAIQRMMPQISGRKSKLVKSPLKKWLKRWKRNWKRPT